MTEKKEKNSSKIVTLTTDWGNRDYFAGAVKGKLYSLIPDVRVVDISHDIENFDINHAGYVIKNAFSFFPEGSIHILGVDSEEYANNNEIQSHLIVKYKSHYFIGADNGIFSMIAPLNDVEAIYELTIPYKEINGEFKYIFPERDRFVYAAAHLANGGDITEIAKPIEEFKELLDIQPVYSNEYIRGTVIHVDGYENAVVNISKKLFESLVNGRKFVIVFRNVKITVIHEQYSDVPDQHIVALFNSSGLLEIAINKANASGLLGLRKNDRVSIEFYD